MTLNWSCKGLRIISGRKLGVQNAVNVTFLVAKNPAVTKWKFAQKISLVNGISGGPALAVAEAEEEMTNTKMIFCPVVGCGIATDLLELKVIMKITQ